MDLVPNSIKNTKQLVELGSDDGLLKACDEALNACIEADKSKTEVIDAQRTVIEEQSRQIDKLEASSHDILKSPVLWFVAGALVTSLTIAIIKK